MKILNLYLIFFLLALLLFGGCKTTSKLSSFEDTLYPNGRPFVVKPVDEATQKRFEYFLMEASRYKMLADYGKTVLFYKEALAIDSTCATCYYEIGQLLYQSGDVKNAEIFALKAVQNDPTNVWFLTFLSSVYNQNDKPLLALEASKYLSDQSPSNIEYLYNVAQYQYSMGSYDDAILTMNRIEKVLGKNEVLSLEKHSIYVQKKDYKAAENELKSLINSSSSKLIYRVYLGDYYVQRKMLDEAFREYSSVIVADSTIGVVYFSLANYYLIKNDSTNFKSSLFKAYQSTNLEFDVKFEKFVPFLMSIDNEGNPLNSDDYSKIFNIFTQLHPHESKVHLLQANYLKHIGKIEEALVSYENALLIDQNQEEIWQEFLFLSLNAQSKEIFLKNCSTAVSVYPESAIIHYLNGVAFSLNDNRQQSIYHLNQVLKYINDNKKLEAQTLGFLGDIYHQDNKHELSFAAYEKSLAIDDNQVTVLNNYAYYLSVSELNLDKAERMISKVIEMEPQNPTYLDTYAWVLFKRERYFEALFIIEQAIEFDKDNNAVLWEHYGDILFKNGNEEKAVEFWKKAYDSEDKGLSHQLINKINDRKFIK